MNKGLGKRVNKRLRERGERRNKQKVRKEQYNYCY